VSRLWSTRLTTSWLTSSLFFSEIDISFPVPSRRPSDSTVISNNEQFWFQLSELLSRIDRTRALYRLTFVATLMSIDFYKLPRLLCLGLSTLSYVRRSLRHQADKLFGLLPVSHGDAAVYRSEQWHGL